MMKIDSAGGPDLREMPKGPHIMRDFSRRMIDGRAVHASDQPICK